MIKTSEFTFRTIQACPPGCIVRIGSHIGILAQTGAGVGVGWLGAWDFEIIDDGAGARGPLFDAIALAYKFGWSIIENHRDGCLVYSHERDASPAIGSVVRAGDDWLMVLRTKSASNQLCWLSLGAHALCAPPKGAQAHFSRWRIVLGDVGAPDATVIYDK
jgi:hypothetical protein